MSKYASYDPRPLVLTPEQIAAIAAEVSAGKQDTLVSGTNIKTVNSESLLGSGNVVAGGTSLTLGDLATNAYPGDKGKTAYDHSQTAHSYEAANSNIQAHVTSSHAPVGAEVNVNADWTASSGDAQIMNKPDILAFSGLTKITVAGTAPVAPATGDLWISTE